MSLVAVTPQQSMCVHGGIPTPVNLQLLTTLNSLKKPLVLQRSTQDRIVKACLEMLWSDPKEKQKREFVASTKRGICSTYNKKAVRDFLKLNELQRIIRGHEASRGSYESMFGGKLIHIFTSEPYSGKIPVGMLVHESDSVTYIRNLQFEVVKVLS